MFGEVVGGDERQDVEAEGLSGFIGKRPDRGVLDSAVDGLGLAVGSRVVWLGQPMLDAAFVAGAIEHVAHAIP